MKETDLRILYRQPWVMFASDGGVDVWPGKREKPGMPRDTGTYPRILRRYVRELEWLVMADAIRKMTALPASRLKLSDRGSIRPGAAADLVLFNPATVKDRSTWLEPSTLSEGIEKVLVNGQLVWDGGKPTGARPGRVLHH
jgi:N-acyl-D-amino-acid deacylase